MEIKHNGTPTDLQPETVDALTFPCGKISSLLFHVIVMSVLLLRASFVLIKKRLLVKDT